MYVALVTIARAFIRESVNRDGASRSSEHREEQLREITIEPRDPAHLFLLNTRQAGADVLRRGCVALLDAQHPVVLMEQSEATRLSLR